MLLGLAVEGLRQRAADQASSAAFTPALEEALGLAGYQPGSLAARYGDPFDTWPKHGDIINRLWNSYSKVPAAEIVVWTGRVVPREGCAEAYSSATGIVRSALWPNRSLSARMVALLDRMFSVFPVVVSRIVFDFRLLACTVAGRVTSLVFGLLELLLASLIRTSLAMATARRRIALVKADLMNDAAPSRVS